MTDDTLRAALDATLAELAESPLPGARYAYTVVKHRMGAALAASAPDEGPHYERFGDAYVARPAAPVALDETLADWTERRAELRNRWSGNGLSPMTAFEMAGAVTRDANVGECETCDHHDMDHYDRRVLLDLVSVLLDRLAARPAVPALDVGLRAAGVRGDGIDTTDPTQSVRTVPGRSGWNPDDR